MAGVHLLRHPHQRLLQLHHPRPARLVQRLHALRDLDGPVRGDAGAALVAGPGRGVAQAVHRQTEAAAARHHAPHRAGLRAQLRGVAAPPARAVEVPELAQRRAAHDGAERRGLVAGGDLLARRDVHHGHQGEGVGVPRGVARVGDAAVVGDAEHGVEAVPRGHAARGVRGHAVGLQQAEAAPHQLGLVVAGGEEGDHLLSAADDPSVSQSVFTITVKAPTRASTFKTLLRHYAKQTLSPRSVDVKLGCRRNYHKGRAAIRHYGNQTARPL